jgi:hypothetical protein
MNQDVLFITDNTALAYSEKLDAFTSFYDYGMASFFCNLDDTGVWIKDATLWKHQAGDYCNFFGTQKTYWITLVGNPEPQVDKIFTNLEFRACVEGEGEEVDGKYTPYLPFTTLETWNEYQHGLANLKNLRGHSAFMHDMGQGVASLKRKFRIWRCDIPRDNVGSSTGASSTFDDTFDYTFKGGKQTRKAHPNDRMRNPWLFIKLQKNAAETGKYLHRTELHDLMVTYFG